MGKIIQETNLFNFDFPFYKITKPIRLIELFGGIGSQAKALKNIGANFEHYKLVEFDKYCIKSYNAIHGTDFNTQDIKQVKGEDLEIVDTDKFTYLLTYSFPCTDLSKAGKMEGMSEESGTRSSLLWEVKRLLQETKNLPQVLLMENVPEVHSANNISDFSKFISFLEKLGYSNFYADLNSKNYGIPQNRDRCFVVSLLGNFRYEFPKPFKLELRLKDMLEDEVDKKYFLSDKMIKCFSSGGTSNFPRGDVFLRALKRTNEKNIAGTITTKAGSRPTDNFVFDKIVKLGNYTPSGHSASSVIDPNGIAPTVMENHGTVTSILLKEKLCNKLINEGLVKEGDVVNHSYSTSRMNKPRITNNGNSDCVSTLTTRGDILGVVVKEKNLWTKTQKQMIAEDGNIKRYLDSDKVDVFNEGQVGDISFPNGYNKGTRAHDECPTINTTTTQSSFITKESQVPLHIRKLTPKECWRLMGFADEDFEKAEKVNSNNQLFKQAGNSIVVQVLEEIFKKLF